MVYVDGIGIVSALGIGVEINLQALRNHADGIRLIRNFSTAINVPAGELAQSNKSLQQILHISTQHPTSRTSLLGMIAASEAIGNASLTDLSQVAFISATSVGGMDLTPTFYAQYMHNEQRGKLRYVVQHDCASSTNAIAEYCHIGGFRTAISTACSSATNAIMMGARLIENGLVSTAIVGGTDALCAYTIDGFKSLMILDSNKCRPFDASRAGLNLGEGAAYLVLSNKPSTHTLCALTGWGNANDAFHQTAVSTEGTGPQLSMLSALNKAQLSSSAISYINAHGTGTPNNDASEATAIRSIWTSDVPTFSSTKAFTGHTLAAAGAIEAVFSVLAIKHQQAWGNLNFAQPMPEQPTLIPLRQTTSATINHVLSNSFGFGGNCSSVIFSRL